MTAAGGASTAAAATPPAAAGEESGTTTAAGTAPAHPLHRRRRRRPMSSSVSPRSGVFTAGGTDVGMKIGSCHSGGGGIETLQPNILGLARAGSTHKGGVFSGGASSGVMGDRRRPATAAGSASAGLGLGSGGSTSRCSSSGGGGGGGIRSVEMMMMGGWHPAAEPDDDEEDGTHHDSWRKMRVEELIKDPFLTPGRSVLSFWRVNEANYDSTGMLRASFFDALDTYLTGKSQYYCSRVWKPEGEALCTIGGRGGHAEVAFEVLQVFHACVLYR